jgi:hypothetical protein
VLRSLYIFVSVCACLLFEVVEPRRMCLSTVKEI